MCRLSPSNILLASLCLGLLLSEVRCFTPVSQGCDQRSCYPATGNLLIGRESKLSATDTCGLEEKSRYCIISSLDPHTLGRGVQNRAEKCYWCDASNPIESHNITKIVHRWEPPEAVSRSEQRMTWWQASNGQENATIQLDLEAEFHVTHIIITFKTFRPAAMFVEKSYDWGKTWNIHRYFSADCASDFPGVHQGVPRHLEEVVCQRRYSRIEPSTKGEVIYRVLPPSINIHSPGFNPYSKEVQDLLKTTNLRLTFTRLHKLGDEQLDMNPVDIKEKYYYSIYDMIVRGSCSCYGHAARCLPEKKEHENIPGMVHGTCECSHYTMGNNCELCMDFYHDMPWRPATGRKKNECKRCNCNEHSDKCHFDEAVWEATSHTSGGVCENCAHNTEGRNCESCISGYYQDPELPPSSPDICRQCDCEPDGTTNNGVCDGKTDELEEMVAGKCHCKKFADGPRCDRCMEGYWNFTAMNPDACQQCTCNPLGTANTKGCNQDTGECRCKRNVVGRDCDQCRPQHFGLSNDVMGCQACDCDPGGAIDNNCNVMTGDCYCRPNITGRRCDQVMETYYTGALDFLLFEAELAHGSENPPTKVTKKKPSDIEGETTWTGFGYMLVFEGSTLTFDIPQIHRTMHYNPVIRYAHLPAQPNTWERVSVELVRVSGPPDPLGRCASADDGPVVVSLPAGNISQELAVPFCLEAGLRYQIKVTFDQYDPVQPSQASIYIDSIALLPEVSEVPFLDPTWEDPVARKNRLCQLAEQNGLEGSGAEGSGTGLVLEGSSDQDYDSQLPEDDCNAPLKIHRMSVGWSPGPEEAREMKDLFDRLGCRDFFLDAKPTRTMPMPRECMKILYSISFFVHEGAFDRKCDCNTTGSYSTACDTYYGGCECKTLVVGRRCAACAPASFGFSSTGCKRCECHYQGSQDEFCKEDTGQCNCHDNAYGRRCDECKIGFWNFPNCQKCQCNLHAIACDAKTGDCINCRDHTTGSFCERCKIGFYGNPIEGDDNVKCQPCPCPDIKSTGHSYAESCYLDETTREPICDCRTGYGGERCDICSDNYFGDPEIPGGECRMCNCSGNWEELAEGNCDPHTGKCLKCVYSTEGFNCEHCKAGFFGDAVGGMCSECTCNPLGTDPAYQLDDMRFACDRVSGECPCLPNVEGAMCDQCIENHWRIASGTGCEACDCDPVGSTGPSCDPYIGQCNCKPGFGGQKCDQCEENFWGDPRVECIPCNCNNLGVNPDRTQCDRTNGTCFCMKGISGRNCDQCARGYKQYHPLSQDHPVMTRNIPPGAMPDCQKCGECFDNWDRILADLRDKTTVRVQEAEQVKVTGAAGAYPRAFESMEANIETVKDIISSAYISVDELADFQKNIDNIASQLNRTTQRMDDLDNGLSGTKQAIDQGQYNLTTLRQEADRLQQSASDVRDQATQLQEANVRGAIVLTEQAKMRSDQAAAKVDKIAGNLKNSPLALSSPLEESKRQRNATERLMMHENKSITSRQVNNTNALQDITKHIAVLQDKVPGLNKAVCDGDTDRDTPCDELCGGAGCGKCGGLSCLQGALQKAKEAHQHAEGAEKIFAEKDLEAESVLNEVSSAYADVERAERTAQLAFDRASQAKNRSLGELDQVNILTEKIDEFLGDDKATPEQVKSVAIECLNATMDMGTDQIKYLAEEINKAIESVTDVDKINEATAEPLRDAQYLERQANQAKHEAAERLNTAENVIQSLTDSEDAQNVATQAIANAQADIAAARRDLGRIETEMDAATSLSRETFDRTQQLLGQQQALQTIYIANEDHVKNAKTAAEQAMTKADKASKDLYKLNTDFGEVSASLAEKSDKIGSAKNRALDLQRRANNLAHSASSKLTTLQDMEAEYEENQRQLDALSSQLTELNCKMQTHLLVIQDKSNFYRTCSSQSTWVPQQFCQCPTGASDPVCTNTNAPAVF